MARIFRKFRRSAKFFGVWFVIGLLAFVFWLQKTCQQYEAGTCEKIAQDAVSVALVIFALVIGGVVIGFLKRIAIGRKPLQENFRDKPWDYDRCTICLIGKVEKVWNPTTIDRLRRRVTDTLRKLAKDDDPVGRFAHQRFLLSSPQIDPGSNILVIHNVTEEKLILKKGHWLEVQGQYLHQRSRKRTAFGTKLTKYGKLHYTHPPQGFVRPLEKKPNLGELLEVKIVQRYRLEKA